MVTRMTKKSKLYVYPILWLLRGYQLILSPWMTVCRFRPTCSEYSMEAFQRLGFLKGTFLTMKRLLRCHPWGGHGFDPVIWGKSSKKLKVASSKRNVYKSEDK